MNIIRVKNMISNSGNEIANQFEIYTPKGRFFQSYNSIIAFIPNDRSKKIKLDKIINQLKQQNIMLEFINDQWNLKIKK